MKKLFIAITAALAVTAAGTVLAEEETVTKRMDEVVVTGTRYEQEIAKVPANVSVITAEDIQKSGAQSVPDILRVLGGVTVSDLNGNGNNQVIDMGGFGESADRHVAVVINGRRVNPIEQSSVRWTLIPVNNIERIEVLYGSGAVLYGDNAMGGVINIITKDIKEGVSVDVEAAGGNNVTSSGSAIFNYNSGAFGVQLGGNRNKTNGYRDRTKAERSSVYGKVQVYPSDTIMLSLDVSAGESEYQLPGSLTEAQMTANRKQAAALQDEGKDEDFFIGLGAEFDFDAAGVLTLRANRREEDRDSDMVSWASYMMIESETDGLNAQYVYDLDLDAVDNRLTVGIDYYETDYDAYRGAAKGSTTNKFDHTKETLSYYLQDEFTIMDAVILNAGIRYEDPELNLATDFDGSAAGYAFNDSETAWHFGVSYNFNPGSKVYARVYEAFRYPVVDEFTSLYTGAINTGLKQETSEGYELGARYSIASKLVLNARIYTMDIENEIAYSNVTWQNENLDETRHKGFEADFRYQTCSFAAIFGNVGYTDAEFRQGDYAGKKIPLVPEWKYNLGIDMKYEKFSGKIQYNYVGEKYFGGDYANDAKQMDSYQTVDVYFGYEFGKGEFFINAANILGEEYSDYGFYNSWGPDFFSYYPMPEATYRAGIKLSF